jgi:heme oxygenase (biliverdin-IX-beta and delta-forming)
MLSEILKEKILIKHQELEKKLVVKMRAMSTIDDYVLLLQLFYSYFGGLEKVINPHISLKLLPDYQERRKVMLISADLHTLSAEAPLTANDDNLPKITGTAEALGALYVMEGSTLGGQFIKKMISKQLTIDETYAMLFFNGYGQDTQQMWSSFKLAMDNYSSPETDEIVINSANQTFQKFSNWFEIHYNSIRI